MTNNTIPNVPRELLADLLGNDHDKRIMAERHLLAMLANAPSPAGVDGLKRYEVFPYLDDDVAELDICESDDGTFVKYAAAQAIIDGLRGEVAEQEEAANQWRELALQFDRHRMTAMAHIRAAASGDKSAIEVLGVFAALPPIPGHEITAAHERQAQRIGELEGLLREVAATLAWIAHGECRAIHDGPIMPSQMALDVAKAALSAGKEGE